MKNFISIFVSMLLLWACNKADEDLASSTPLTSESKELLFGHYYGECGGEECVEIFKLTSQALFEDQLDIYAGVGPFDFKKLNFMQFQKAKGLFDLIPEELLLENDSIFGCPDCADQGGLLIQYTTNASVKTWRIDQRKSAVPTYLHAFIDNVNLKIQTINQ